MNNYKVLVRYLSADKSKKHQRTLTVRARKATSSLTTAKRLVKSANPGIFIYEMRSSLI